MPAHTRRHTVTALVGGVPVGSGHPIVVQSMTNTDTADVPGTVRQVAALARAGSQLVRVTVNNEDAAAAVPRIVEGLEALGVSVPIIGDFHYNGHLLLTRFRECARALAKYRINPGNVGGKRADENFRAIIEIALANEKPVRIGVNWGSLDQNLLTEMMDANAHLPVAPGCAGCNHGGDGRERPAVRGAGRGVGDVARSDHPEREGVRGPGSGGRLPHAGGALRVSVAPRSHRGGPRGQGHHREHRGPEHPAPGGHRRHHSRLADAGARGRPNRGGPGRAAGPPVARRSGASLPR